MKDISTLIYIAIIVISIFGGLLGKKKKSSQPGQPANRKPQKKTLEDIIREITGETETPRPQQPAPVVQAPSPKAEPSSYYSMKSSLEDITEENTEVYVEDSEDVLAMDDVADHHVHGKGFDQPRESPLAEVEQRFEIQDWRKAIIVAEILKRPEY